MHSQYFLTTSVVLPSFLLSIMHWEIHWMSSEPARAEPLTVTATIKKGVELYIHSRSPDVRAGKNLTKLPARLATEIAPEPAPLFTRAGPSIDLARFKCGKGAKKFAENLERRTSILLALAWIKIPAVLRMILI